MEWTLEDDSPGPGIPRYQPCRFTLLRLPGGTRQAMVEPLRIDRPTRDGRRTWSESAAKAGQHCHLALPSCDAVVAVDATGCAVLSWLRRSLVSCGCQHRNLIYCLLPDVGRRFLPHFHHRCRSSLQELSVPNSGIALPSLSEAEIPRRSSFHRDGQPPTSSFQKPRRRRPTSTYSGPPVRFMGSLDIPGQNHPPVNLTIPFINTRTPRN